MKVIAYDPFVTKERGQKLGVEMAELDELLARADFVTLHVPLTDATRSIINRDAIEKMKAGAFLINAARGGLVDEVALVDALRSNKLSGAAFDVFEKEPPAADHPLLQLDNFIATPHLGASTDEAQVNVAVAIAEQIVGFLTTGAVRNAINAPAVSADLMDIVGPYIRLGRKAGSMAGQLHRGGVQEVRAIYAGATAELPVQSVTASMLAGLLATGLGTNVNSVNAPYLAKERGIEVIEERTSKAGPFAQAVTLRVKGDDETTEIVGALFGEDERIVGVNGTRLEIIPDGHLLFTHHRDRPGIIGAIGSILGRRIVNISRMNLSEGGGSELAHAVFNIDKSVSAEVLSEISSIDGIESVRQLHID